MRPAQAVMADLAASGLTPDQLALVIELSATVAAEARPAIDRAAENKRAYDREYRRTHKRNRTKSYESNDAVPPNERDNLTPSGSQKPEPRGSVKKFGPPDGVSAETWSDFLLSPKRRKAGMSATAYAGITNNLALLAEHGFPPGEMIALAVERGWTTVKLEWVLNDQRTARNERNNSPSPLDQLVAASLGYGHGTRESS